MGFEAALAPGRRTLKVIAHFRPSASTHGACLSRGDVGGTPFLSFPMGMEHGFK